MRFSLRNSMIVLAATAFAAVIGAKALWPAPPAPPAPAEEPENVRHWRAFRTLPDEELRARFEQSLDDYVQHLRTVEFEACLYAIGERRDPIWGDRLQRALRRVENAASRCTPGSSEIVAALRRSRGCTDPIAISIRSMPSTWTWADMPVLEVALRNICETPLKCTRDGGYRCGREQRWRIEAVDAWGRRVVLAGSGDQMRGGLYGERLLQPAEEWRDSLATERYLGALAPGVYRLRVFYSDNQAIAQVGSLEGLIVYGSPPIDLEVRPRLIRPSRAQREAACAAIAALRDGVPVAVVRPYDAAWHGLIPPDTPHGRLMGLGWNAVPDLLEALLDRPATRKRRAWLLALLWATTGVHDPWKTTGYTAETAIGDYEEFSTFVTMGVGHPQPAGVRPARISPEAQEALIAKWRECRRFVIVEER